MGILVCQTCETTIEHFENDKVVVLYCKCTECDDCEEELKVL